MAAVAAPSSSRRCWAALLLLVVVLAGSVTGRADFSSDPDTPDANGLIEGFYHGKCRGVERTIRRAVFRAVWDNPGVAPGLIRLFFHDCFGNLKCDGSLLLDETPTDGNNTEKDSVANSSLRGFEVVDDAKSDLEEACPGVVSCTDILTYAARDAVFATGGFWFPVAGGRRDGVESKQSDPLKNLPPPSFKVDQLTANFAKGGLTQAEMVTLSGAHTFGRSTICLNFFNRIYNFSASSPVDPTLDPRLVKKLQAACPLNNGRFFRTNVVLDPVTPNRFDNRYYRNLVNKQGLFTSDQDLYQDARTRGQVLSYAADGYKFFDDFEAAFNRLAAVGVLTGTDGEVRLDCRRPNPGGAS